MESYERRTELCNVMRLRRYDTVGNLANEFGVSERTIRRDIEVLSLKEPIYTTPGRYGGVYFTGRVSQLKHLTNEQESILIKIIQIAERSALDELSANDIVVLKQILVNYKKPPPEHK